MIMPLPQSLADAIMGYQQEQPGDKPYEPQLPFRRMTAKPHHQDDAFLEGNRFKPSDLEKRVYGDRKPELPGETNRGQRMAKKDVDAISQQKYLESAAGLMGFAGNVTNTPFAMARDVVAGKNPLPGVLDPSKRTSGRDLGEKWGMAGPNEDQGWIPDWGDLVGTGIEALGDLGTGLGARMVSKAGSKLATLGANAMGKGDAFGGFTKDRINSMLDARRKMSVVKLKDDSSPLRTAKFSGPKITAEQAPHVKSLFRRIVNHEIGGSHIGDPNGSFIVSLPGPREVRHELFHGYANAAKNGATNLPIAPNIVGKMLASSNRHVRGAGKIANEALAPLTSPSTKVSDLVSFLSGEYTDQFRRTGVPEYQVQLYKNGKNAALGGGAFGYGFLLREMFSPNPTNDSNADSP